MNTIPEFSLSSFDEKTFNATWRESDHRTVYLESGSTPQEAINKLFDCIEEDYTKKLEYIRDSRRKLLTNYN